MKLQEIVGVKKYKDKTPDEIAFDASWYGFEKIGQGTHALAFEKDGVVYKFWASDAPYDDFVSFCMSNQSKFLPQFKSKAKSMPTFFLKAPGFPDRIKYIKMEKLEKLGSLEMQVTENYKMRVDVIIDSLPRSPKNDGYEGFLQRLFKDRPMVKMDQLTDEVKEFFAILKGLLELSSKHDYSMDLHENNIMRRGDTPVIIDPMAVDDSVLKNGDWEKFYAKILVKKRRAESGS